MYAFHNINLILSMSIHFVWCMFCPTDVLKEKFELCIVMNYHLLVWSIEINMPRNNRAQNELVLFSIKLLLLLQAKELDVMPPTLNKKYIDKLI